MSGSEASPDQTTSPPDPAGTTPSMAQYLTIKRDHPDALLFYRMGDFYEMFFTDAVTAARALDIALTKRGKHGGEDIPMCGVPVHSHEAYLSRLIRQGHKVAICEQLEDPEEARRKRGYKAVVERGVVRIITPGTLTEDNLLDARSHNHLAALAEAQGGLGLAWVDVSTGDLSTQPIAAKSLAAALARLAPTELLVPDRLLSQPDLFETWNDWKACLTPLPSARFDSENGRRRLETLYGVGALDGFGAFGRPELAAAGALVDYVELTQKGKLPRLSIPRRLGDGAVMEIDAATRRNLELAQTLSGERRGSLLWVVDRTVTGAGARLLSAHLAAPLTDPTAIDRRLDMVEFLAERHSLRDSLRERLRRVPDMERALSRLTLGRGGPRDLAAIRDGLAEVPGLRESLRDGGLTAPPLGIQEAAKGLGQHGVVVERLQRALAQDLPMLARDGAFIAAGYDPSLDELRSLRDESARLIRGLQDKYAAETGVASLKIKENNVLGWFIEVPPKQADRMGTGFIHRQTIASSVRFVTVELTELEQKVRQAAQRTLALELQLYDALVAEVIGRANEIGEAARAIAAIDVAAGLADLAVERRYVRPVIEDSSAFSIGGGRHPVVEAMLPAGTSFVANDCDLGLAQRLWLVTGPNMAGKSTFLRQNALIAVMAQMGSFVPADTARIGVVDRLFSRVGAADDLARGRSTFMVEMVETAAILNQSGPRALVVLDEIGRGTATYDGLSIAWSVVEHLHEVNRCRALFATHYHELTHLSSKLPALSCHSMRVKEWQGEVVFLHEVGPGAADRSYGIHVAKLAGLPPAVIDRAEAVLEILEKGDQSSAATRLADDLPLFAAATRIPARTTVTTPAAAEPSVVEQELRALNPDNLSPRQALEELYRLRGLVR
jgi:DNA mismatch repair protein MutS